MSILRLDVPKKKIRIKSVSQTQEILKEVIQTGYKYGFESNIETEMVPKGLNEATIRLISAKKNEPEWMLAWRITAYKHWLTIQAPKWSNVNYPSIDYQNIIYYAAPQKKPILGSLDEVDPELLATFEKLGISLKEQKRLANVAMDVVMDSVSVATTFQKTLQELGIIFCSFSEAVQKHPELVKKLLGHRSTTRGQLFCCTQCCGL